MAYIINNLFLRRGLKQLAILLITAFVLSACGESRPDPVCVGSDDLGDRVSKSKIVESTNSAWIDTGIDVLAKNKLSIKMIGAVNVCPILACNGTNGKFMKAEIRPSSGSNLTIPIDDCWKASDAGGTSNCGDGTYSTSNSAIAGRVWVRLDDSIINGGDGNYAAYVINPTNPVLSLTQCSITAFTSNNESNKTACLNRLNAFTSYTAGTTIVGHVIDLSKGSISGSSDCRVTGATADDGLSSTATACVDTINTKLSIIAPDVSSCTVNSFTSSDADNLTSCTSVLNSILSTSHQVTSSQGAVAGTDFCLVTSASSSTCMTNINSLLTTSPAASYSASGSNTGSYSVSVATNKPVDETFSKTIINDIVNPIRNILLGDATATPPRAGLTETMYKGVTGNSEFILGVKALIALTIVFFAFNYMVGLSKITHTELIKLVIKISFVLAMISPTSWEFFSTYLFSLFIKGSDSLIYIMTNNINAIFSFVNPTLIDSSSASTGSSQANAVFGFLNTTMSIIFSQEANIKLSALLVTFPIGPVVATAIYLGICFFLYAVVKSLLAYLTSIIMISLLLFLAPIFICFILFAKTKEMFDRWVRVVASFALQPVFLFILLSVFNVLVILTLYNILGFSACYTCVLTIDLPISEMLAKVGDTFTLGLANTDVQDFDKFCAMHGYLPWGIDATEGNAAKLAKTPVGLVYALVFVMLANMMLKFTNLVERLAGDLVGDQTGSLSSQGAGRALGEAGGMAKHAASAGVSTAKFVAKKADEATGHVVSDTGIKIARSRILPNFITKGGKDATGEKLAVSTSFMTSGEKKGYERKMAGFANLTSEEQTAVRKENKNLNEENKLSKRSSEAKNQMRQAQLNNLSALGKGSNSVLYNVALGGRAADRTEITKDLIKSEFKNKIDGTRNQPKDYKEALRSGVTDKHLQREKDAADKQIQRGKDFLNRMSGGKASIRETLGAIDIKNLGINHGKIFENREAKKKVEGKDGSNKPTTYETFRSEGLLKGTLSKIGLKETNYKAIEERRDKIEAGNTRIVTDKDGNERTVKFEKSDGALGMLGIRKPIAVLSPDEEKWTKSADGKWSKPSVSEVETPSKKAVIELSPDKEKSTRVEEPEVKPKGEKPTGDKPEE